MIFDGETSLVGWSGKVPAMPGRGGPDILVATEAGLLSMWLHLPDPGTAFDPWPAAFDASTGRSLVVRDATGARLLGYWPGVSVGTGGACGGGLRVLRLRGSAPDEVFLAVVEPQPQDQIPVDGFSMVAGGPGCFTHPFVLYWDGAVFHWI